MLYSFVLLTMQLWDMYDNLNDLKKSLVRALEWPFKLSMVICIIIIRRNKKLTMVFTKIRHEMNCFVFESDEEKRLYLKYNTIAYKASKFMLVFVSTTVYLHHARPLIRLLIYPRIDAENNTLPFVLPLRLHVIFDYRYNAKLYTILYMYVLLGTYVTMCHIAEATLIFTSTLHVCARMAMLSYRIRKSLTESPAHFQQRIKLMVNEHLELTELTGFLNDCFRNVLLIEYLNCSLRLGVVIYVMLLTFGNDKTAFFNFILYTVTVAGWLYGYSYIGEQLYHESLNIGDAFYDTDWTSIAARDRKSLLICILNGQQAQYLTAGKFYKFSLFGFSEIVKSSMAFFSVLRTIME